MLQSSCILLLPSSMFSLLPGISNTFRFGCITVSFLSFGKLIFYYTVVWMEKTTQHFIRLLISFLPICCIFSPGKKGRTMQFQTFCLWSVTIKFTFVGSSNLDFRSFWLLGLVGLTSPLEPPLGIWAPCLPLRIQICCWIKATYTFSSLRAGLLAVGI